MPGLGEKVADCASMGIKPPRTMTWLTLAAFGCGMLALTLAGQSPKYAWVFEGESEHVSLWTSELGRTSLGAMKAATRFRLPAAPLVEVLRDVADYPRWYRDCAQTRVLRGPKAPGPVTLDAKGKFVPGSMHDAFRLFFLQRVSMLSDRWAIIENQTQALSDGSLLISFRTCDDCAYESPAEAVRMALSGEWRLTPIDAGHTLVTYLVDLDLRSDVPNFIVRPKVKDAARATLLALGARALARMKSSTAPAR